jgi:hypothetical protein
VGVLLIYRGKQDQWRVIKQLDFQSASLPLFRRVMLNSDKTIEVFATKHLTQLTKSACLQIDESGSPACFDN